MMTRRAFTALGGGAFLLGPLGLGGCNAVPIDPERIESVRHSSGGGMTGGGSSTELRRQKDGSVILSTREREWHNSRETGMDYACDASVFERLAQIANDYDLRAASKRRDQEFQTLDAPTSSLSFSMREKDGSYDIDSSFTISSEQELTARDHEGWNAVLAVFADVASESEGVAYEEPHAVTLSSVGMQHRFILNDSTAALELAKRCPLEIELEDYADDGKAFLLDDPLDVGDAPLTSGKAGTLCYLEPSNEVVAFYADAASQEGLYELGHIQYDYNVRSLAEVETGPSRLWSDMFIE